MGAGLGPLRVMVQVGTQVQVRVLAGLQALSRPLITPHMTSPTLLAPSSMPRPACPPQGLAEVYEDDYVRTTTGGVTEDKDDKVRAGARALLQALFFKLDALSHYHFAPKPVVADMTIKSDVAALVMEEAAPVLVSKAGLQVQAEVFGAQASGAPKAEGEMSRWEGGGGGKGGGGKRGEEG